MINGFQQMWAEIKNLWNHALRLNSFMLKCKLKCMMVKCEIILSDVSEQHDDRIDTYRLIFVSIVYR